MAENVLTGDYTVVQKMRNEFINRDNIDDMLIDIKDKKRAMDKEIAAEEKSINDEIKTTVKKRRNELEKKYDAQLSEIKSEEKKTSKAKEKEKGAKMDDRVSDETAGYVAASEDKEKELRKFFKQEGVPKFCASRIFYILFMPKGAEIIQTLLFFIVFLVGLPGGITFAIRELVLKKNEAMSPTMMTFWTVLIPAVWIILFLVIYFLIYIKVKTRHLDALREGRNIRNAISKDEKQIRDITKSIKKDDDESIYGLGEYDAKLSELSAKSEAISAEKKAALDQFDTETVQAITDDINGRRLGKLNEMKSEAEDLGQKIEATEEQQKNLALEISNKYGVFIGDDLCRTEVMDELLEIMNERGVVTVSEALEIYKSNDV